MNTEKLPCIYIDPGNLCYKISRETRWPLHIGDIAVGACRERARNILTEWLDSWTQWNKVVRHRISSLATVNRNAGGDRIVEVQGDILSRDGLSGLKRKALNRKEGLAAAAILDNRSRHKCHNCCNIGEKHDGYTYPVATVDDKFYFVDGAQHVCESPFATR